MSRHHPITRLALLLPVALAACSGPPASLSYFPLEAGHRWVYEQASGKNPHSVEPKAGQAKLKIAPLSAIMVELP